MPSGNPPTSEIGNAGVTGRGMGQGFARSPIDEVVELTWPLAVRAYDRMRRSDSKVAASLRAMLLPIMAADWRVIPRQAKPEVVERVADDLGLPIINDDERQPSRTRDRFDFAFYLRHALLSRVYGFMPFEQVYRIDPDGFARIRKLAPRMPHTLTYNGIRVAPDGGLAGIEQYPVSGSARTVFIPVDRLVVHVFDREGAAWHGQSILRPVYRDWLLKEHYHRIASIAVDRNGAGVPIYTDAGSLDDEEAKAEAAAGQKLAESYRAGQNAGGRVPKDAKFEIKGVEGTTPDILEYVRYHDEQIAQNTLEMFSTLPSAPNGSRALGQSLVSFFTTALNAHALEIATTTTNHVIEDWVDINYGPDEASPAISSGEIGAEQQLTAMAIKQLIDCKALTPDPELERYLRRYYRLPQITDGPPPAADDAPAQADEAVEVPA